MSVALLNLSDIESAIHTRGEVQFQIAGRSITLNLSHRHERSYAAHLLLNIAYPQGDIDLMLFHQFLRAGDTVLDAGANIGFTALKCVNMGAKMVVAVEPVPELYSRLAQVADNVVISVNKAISSKSGKQHITVSQAHNQGSTLKKNILALFPGVFGVTPPRIEVETTTIDALTDEYGPFDLWKLDIEGSEVDAVKGASNTLRTRAPRVIMTELFGSLSVEFRHELKGTYAHQYRAMIQKSDYSLRLMDYNAEANELFHQTSPTYIFSKERLA